jgi:hypothetical protein
MAALTGIHWGLKECLPVGELAEACYKVADAMLEARKK